MKLNPDCIRDVLIAVESCDFGERLNLDSLHDACPQYTENELWYTCLKLNEGNFLDIDTVSWVHSTMPSIKSINCLTFSGHEFLANIQPNTIWEDTKKVIKKIGVTSIQNLSVIASGVVTAIIKSQLGLA